MPRVLLDSDVIIWYLRGRADVVARVTEFARDAVPACSALSVVEVESGMKAGEESRTRAFLASMVVYPLDGAIASDAAGWMRRLRLQGRTVSLVDACIASTCLVHRLHLATFNRRHFRFPGLTLATL